MHCRYEHVNRSALRDAQLYDETGRVRSPSVGTVSGSEDGSRSEDGTVPDVAKFLDDDDSDAYEDFSLPHQVYVVGDHTEHHCSLETDKVIEDSSSETTVAGEDDSDYNPSSTEGGGESTSVSTLRSRDDGNSSETTISSTTASEEPSSSQNQVKSSK